MAVIHFSKMGSDVRAKFLCPSSRNLTYSGMCGSYPHQFFMACCRSTALMFSTPLRLTSRCLVRYRGGGACCSKSLRFSNTLPTFLQLLRGLMCRHHVWRPEGGVDKRDSPSIHVHHACDLSLLNRKIWRVRTPRAACRGG